MDGGDGEIMIQTPQLVSLEGAGEKEGEEEVKSMIQTVRPAAMELHGLCFGFEVHLLWHVERRKTVTRLKGKELRH